MLNFWSSSWLILGLTDVTAIRFLLNKMDLWERSVDRDYVIRWFNETVTFWKNQTNASVTSSTHSNRDIHDVNSLIEFLSAWSSS